MAGSKKFRDKVCVYCRKNNSTTADHVFPRELFQNHERDNLPKVPACAVCNNAKSKLEHYLTATLPFGATHDNAETALSVDVSKRLSKNKKLQRELETSYSQNQVSDSKLGTRNALTISLDFKKLEELCSYIAIGLMWHHWEKLLPFNFSHKAFIPSEYGLEIVDGLFNMTSDFRINEVIGDNTIKYKGTLAEVDKGMSVWAIQLLGGITIADNNFSNVFENSYVAVITGSPTTLENIKLVQQ
ncbi:HNH endonuclease [Shewanella sp. 125m-7]